jgi:uncharacterized protein with GYD domain
MPKYLIKASYTLEGARGVIKGGGSARRSSVEHMAEALGGKVESFYFAFGGDDAYVTVDLPDATTAAAVSLAVNSSGGAQVTTVPLLTPEDVDAAAKKSVDYTPPGG